MFKSPLYESVVTEILVCASRPNTVTGERDLLGYTYLKDTEGHGFRIVEVNEHGYHPWSYCGNNVYRKDPDEVALAAEIAAAPGHQLETFGSLMDAWLRDFLAPVYFRQIQDLIQVVQSSLVAETSCRASWDGLFTDISDLHEKYPTPVRFSGVTVDDISVVKIRLRDCIVGTRDMLNQSHVGHGSPIRVSLDALAILAYRLSSLNC